MATKRKGGRPRRVTCRECGRHVDRCGPLSARGRCLNCATIHMAVNNEEMAAHTGEAYERWVTRTLEGLQRKAQELQAGDEP